MFPASPECCSWSLRCWTSEVSLQAWGSEVTCEEPFGLALDSVNLNYQLSFSDLRLFAPWAWQVLETCSLVFLWSTGMTCARKRAVSLSSVEVSFSSHGRPLTHPFDRIFPNHFSVFYLTDESRLTKTIWRCCFSHSAISFECTLGTAGRVFPQVRWMRTRDRQIRITGTWMGCWCLIPLGVEMDPLWPSQCIAASL